MEELENYIREQMYDVPVKIRERIIARVIRKIKEHYTPKGESLTASRSEAVDIEGECHCECHHNSLKKAYSHDTKCCDMMNGYLKDAIPIKDIEECIPEEKPVTHCGVRDLHEASSGVDPQWIENKITEYEGWNECRKQIRKNLKDKAIKNHPKEKKDIKCYIEVPHSHLVEGKTFSCENKIKEKK